MEGMTTEQISRRFTRALSTYDRHAEAQQLICKRLCDLLQPWGNPHWDRLLEIGCGSGGFTRELHRRLSVGEWMLNDLCPACEPLVAPIFAADERVRFRMGDAEQLDFGEGFDLVASASALQWMKDLPTFLAKLALRLKPGGILLFNTFAPDNLPEIRRLTGRGLDYPGGELLRSWLEPRFEVLEESMEEIRLRFDSPLEVLRHLKYTGVTATGAGEAWTRGRQEAFCKRYEALSKSTGGVSLTYRPHYFVAVLR